MVRLRIAVYGLEAAIVGGIKSQRIERVVRGKQGIRGGQLAMTEIPQPPGLPYIGSLLEIDPKYTVESLRRLGDIHGTHLYDPGRYKSLCGIGPIYRLRIVNISRIVVCNHELFNELCDESRFVKSVSGPLSQMRNLVHDSLFTAHPNEENWGIAHRILAPAFGPVPIRDMFHGT